MKGGFSLMWWKLINNIRTFLMEFDDMPYIKDIQECVKTFDANVV